MSARPDLPELIDAERDFTTWIARDYSSKQIAQETQLALPTVKARVSKLLARFEVKNRRELVQKPRPEKIV